ncbi:hypothetical protein ACFP65_08300 [Marinilactibacillus sp. GCM10026970]|uniref:hypothetical protein n=1 Tax=Marinilactibacillus sp. GCM10026970 TaxID=3252642 RepID=UPI00362262A9
MGYSDLKELLIDARGFAEGANDINLKAKLLDIQGAVYELQDENRELRLKNEELQNNKITASELEVRENHYYLNNQGPYCTKCWDTDSILVRVLKTPIPLRRLGDYRCPSCETHTD